MANTYTQIHLQLVFAVKYRRALIQKSWKEELYKYMTGIFRNHEHQVLAINGVEDHIHILIGYRPAHPLPLLMQELKQASALWVNETQRLPVKFSWQHGYGCFSYMKRDIPMIKRYIARQEEHHRKKAFREEYVALLEEFEVSYDTRYCFEDPV